MQKKLGFLIISVLVLLGLGWWIGQSQYLSQPSIQPAPQTTLDSASPSAQVFEQFQELVVSLEATESGVTAYELLTRQSQVESERSEFGVFINSINGVAGDQGHYWAIYVNDQYATSSADTTLLEPGDRVEFRYEEIESAGL